MATHNWRKGNKIVWTDENGMRFLGTVVEENWREITVSFSDYPAFGLLGGRNETKVLKPHEIHPQGDEEDLLMEAGASAHSIYQLISQTCERYGQPLEGIQSVLVYNAVKHSLYNRLYKQKAS